MFLSKRSSDCYKADKSDLEDDIRSISRTWHIAFAEEKEEKVARNKPETVPSVQQTEQVYLNFFWSFPRSLHERGKWWCK
jgi:hypothetical protein